MNETQHKMLNNVEDVLTNTSDRREFNDTVFELFYLLNEKFGFEITAQGYRQDDKK